MLDFKTLMLFSENPKELAAFYKKVFEKDPDWEMGGYFGFSVGSMTLMIGPHDKVHGKNANPERIMLNFEASDVKGEFDRIKELGGDVIAEPYKPGEEPNMLIATFADPDGNYFQLGSPMDDQMGEKN